MQIELLGPFTVRDHDCVLPLGGTKQRALLALLALHVNEVVPTASLIDGLWGSRLPADPRRTVHIYVSRLRKSLEATTSAVAVRRHQAGYFLEAHAELVDLHRFQRLTAHAATTWPHNPRATADALQSGLGLWRGDALSEFANEPFAAVHAPRLAEMRTSAVRLRIEADLALGRHHQLVDELSALIRQHPLNEEFHAQLMIAYYRCERQADALQVYRLLRQCLSQELGLEPGQRLVRLHEDILRHRPLSGSPAAEVQGGSPHQTAARTAVHIATSAFRTGRFPPRLRSFVGRRQLIRQLRDELVHDPQTPSVHVLYGMGGVGKTQLVIEYGYRLKHCYRHFLWIDAESAVLIPQQFLELATDLGVDNAGQPAVVARRVLRALSRRRDWLLVFDNAADPETVSQYLPAGEGHVVITARAQGWGELAGSTAVEVFARDETVELLVSRIPTMSEEIADLLAAELGDLPLAAAQAASFLEQTESDPASYVERFRTRRAGLLGQGDVLGYQWRVETTWLISLAQLHTEWPNAVAVLEIAAFLGAEPIPVGVLVIGAEFLPEPLRSAAERDPDAVSDAVGAAIRYSLAERRGDMFQVHRLVQFVVRERIREPRRSGVAASAAEVIVANHPGNPHDPAHWPTYRALVAHTIAAQHRLDSSPAGRAVLLDFVRYLLATGDSVVGHELAADVLSRWQRALGNDHVDALSLSAELLFLSTWSGTGDEAAGLGLDLLDRARNRLGDDHPTTLAAAANLTLTLAFRGDSARAIELGADTVERTTAVLGPEHPTTLLAYANHSSALGWAGQNEDAKFYGQAAVAGCKAVLGSDHLLTLHASSMLGYALLWQGDIERAHQLCEDAHTRACATLVALHPTRLWLASALAFALLRDGQWELARQQATETFRGATESLGPDHAITMVAASVAILASLRAGDPVAARTLGHSTLARSRDRYGLDHHFTLSVATATVLAGTASGDASDVGRLLAHDTAERCLRILGPAHPNTRNALAAAAALQIPTAASATSHQDPPQNPPEPAEGVLKHRL